MPAAEPASSTVMRQGTGRCPVCEGQSVKAQHRYAENCVMRCRACGVLFRYPQPPDSQLEEIYSREYYGDPPALSTLDRRPTPRGVVEQVLDGVQRALGDWTGKLVLDFGCGVGECAKEILARGGRVVGIERGSAKEAVSRLGLFDVYEGLDEAWNAGYRRFDVVLMCLVIEHLRDPLSVLKRLRGMMAPKGALYIETANGRSVNARLMRSRWREMRKPEHLFWFDAGSLALACRRAGFRAVVETNRRVRFEDHSVVRRALRSVTGRCGLQGGLRMLARP